MSKRPKRKIEFIESYWTGGECGSDYCWNDNHGELVRCKDCVFRDDRDGVCEHVQQVRDPDWYCADGERKEEDNADE